MEYIYAALLLHKVGKPISAKNLKKVLEASGSTFDEAKARALVAALSGVDIEEAIKSTLTAPTVSPPSPQPSPAREKGEEKKEEKKKEKKEEEEALAGLSSLFG
ncbi:MAG: 50S ribosomal protein P1 [Candidatus Bathyarchaeia archaeon]